MAYGPLLPSVRLAGLERRARFAGEAFGHEEFSGPGGWRDALLRLRLPALIGLGLVLLGLGISTLV